LVRRVLDVPVLGVPGFSPDSDELRPESDELVVGDVDCFAPDELPPEHATVTTASTANVAIIVTR
jgi:hypothetical protein